MFPVMKSAHRLNGILFCVLIGAMLIYSLPVVQQFARSQTNALELFFDGKLLRAFERRYDRQFFLREPSEKAWAALQYQLLGEGLAGVVIGQDGWLFSNQEYLVPSDLEYNLSDQVRQIEAARERLRENGKQLVLLPVPMKVDIYREHARQRPAPAVLELHDRFVSALRERDLAVVPLREAFLAQRTGQPLFLRQDTHWTPQGARLAAQLFAEARPELKGQTAFRSERVGSKRIPGDLRNYLRFPAEMAPWLDEGEEIDLYETLAEQGEADDALLFGEVTASSALVGSSYSKMEDWNFTGFLKEALQADLITMAVEAKGPLQAMEAFLESPQLTDPSITAVIWEYPVRTLLAQRAHSKAWQDKPGQAH